MKRGVLKKRKKKRRALLRGVDFEEEEGFV